MSEESRGFDPYAAVLADLRAQRDKIDQAIQALESIRGIPGRVETSGVPLPLASAQNGTVGPGAFLGMSIPDATKALLVARKQTLGNADIVAALRAGGLHMTSVDPINTVGSVLTRRFNTVGDIVRVGRGTWGLKEWFPNRNFKRAEKVEAATEEATGPSASESP